MRTEASIHRLILMMTYCYGNIAPFAYTLWFSARCFQSQVCVTKRKETRVFVFFLTCTFIIPQLVKALLRLL